LVFRATLIVFPEGHGAMNNLAAAAGAVAFAITNTHASAAVVVPHVSVSHIKIAPKVIAPKSRDNFETKDFSVGVESPKSIGSTTGGAGAGKIKFGEFNIVKPKPKRK
jgi:hypothetical protein